MKNLKLNKKDVYRVPEGYFEDKPAQLLDAIKDIKPIDNTPTVISIAKKVTPWLAVAAVLIIGLFLYNSISVTSISLDEIPQEAIEEYIAVEYSLNTREDVLYSSVSGQLMNEDEEWLEEYSEIDIPEEYIDEEIDYTLTNPFAL